MKSCILIFDRNFSVGMAIHHLAEDQGFVGALFDSADKMAEFWEAEGADLVVIDFSEAEEEGKRLAVDLRVKGFTGKLVVLTWNPEEISEEDRYRLDIWRVVTKSSDIHSELRELFEERSAY